MDKDCVQRIDKIQSPLSITKDNGHTLLWLRVGASNRKLDYGDRTEIIAESDLLDKDSLETLVGCPVCLQHPPSFFLGGKTPKSYIDGVVLQGFEIEETDGEKYLTVPAVIFDDAAIDAISTGDAVEISPGYTCFLESNDGNYYQKQRRYDHVALVSRGRTGSDVSVKLDEQMKEETTTETDTVSVLNPNPTELRRFLIDNAECFQGLPDSTLDRIDTLEQACDLWLSNNLPEALKAVKVDAAGFVSVIKHYQLELTTQQQKTDSIVAELSTKLEKKSEEKTDTESTKSELSDIEIEQKTDSDIIAIARQKYKARTFGITV